MTGRRRWRPPICTTPAGRARARVDHDPQPRLSGPLSGLDLLASSACPTRALRDRRRRIFRRRRLPEGRPAARRPHHHRLADLRARDPDARSSAWRSTASCARAPPPCTASSTASTTTVWNPATDPALPQNLQRAAHRHARCATRPRCRAGSGWRRGVDRPLFGVVSPPFASEGPRPACCRRCPASIAKGGQLALLGSGERGARGGLRRRRRGAAGLGRLRFRLRREARPSLPGGRRFHPRAVALRALRADPALRAALRRAADRRARRRPRRHGHRRQRGGDCRGRRDRRPVLSALRRSARLCARPRARRSAAIRRRCGACRLNGMRADVSWRGPAQRYAALYRDLAGRRHERAEATAAASSSRAQGLEAALDLPNAESASLCLYDGDREVFRAPMARDARWRPARRRARLRRGRALRLPRRGAVTIRRAGAASTPPNCWPILTPGAFDRPFRLHPSMFAFGEDSGPSRAEGDRRRAAGGRAGPQAHRAEALVIYELNLRGFSRLNPAIPEARARNLRRPRPSRLDRASGRARRHRGRDHAGRRVRRRAASAAARPRERLGLQSGRVRRARSAPRARRLGGGARGDRRAARGGHGGDPRRRLQPQRRERPVRPDAVVPRPRQRGLVPPRSARSGALRQRRRHRQLPRARPPAGRRHGDRRAAGAG